VAATARTAKMAVRGAPLEGHLGKATVAFHVAGISGSMALRRRRQFLSFGVKPRLAPEIRTWVFSTPWPR